MTMLPAASAATVGIPRRVRIGYGLGSFCTGTFSTVPGLLLLYYMTNVLDVSPWLAGVVAFLPKAADLFINPCVGRRSDATASRHGPRRPWLLAGAATLPVTFALMFAGPPLRGLPAALYVGVFFFLAAVAYALFEVPYKAMPAEMTDDYHERSAMLHWRMVFLGVAVLMSGAVAPAIATSEAEGGTLGGYRLMGVAVGVLLLAAMLGTFFGTARAPRSGRMDAEPSLRAQLRVARTNRTFLWLLGFSCLQMLAAGTMLAGAPYVATYVLGGPRATSAIVVSFIGPLLITPPLWIRLSRRLDKRGAMIVASAVFMAGVAGLVLTPWLGSGYAYACAVVGGIGYAGLQLLQFSMMADVIAADTLVSAKRRGGVFTGLWTAAETVTFALGALLLSWVLGGAGFIASSPQQPVEQPASAVAAVLLGATLLPAALIAVSILPTCKYDLTAARMEQLRAQESGRLKAATQ